MENEKILDVSPSTTETAPETSPVENSQCCENGVCSFSPAHNDKEENTEAENVCSCCKDEEHTCSCKEDEHECCCKEDDEHECCCKDGADADSACKCCCDDNNDDDASKSSENDAEAASDIDMDSIPKHITTPITQEMLDDASKKLADMLNLLGLKATIQAENRLTKINLVISSDDAGRIIGRKGQNLESLQLVLNRMMQKNDVNCPKVYLDIDGYSFGSRKPVADGEEWHGGPRRKKDSRGGSHSDFGERGKRKGHRQDRFERGEHRNSKRGERRDFESDSADEALRNMALDFAKEVRQWGEPKTLPPMNAHDRRIIHVTLENDKDVKTDSVGEEPNKSVVISLKGE